MHALAHTCILHTPADIGRRGAVCRSHSVSDRRICWDLFVTSDAKVRSPNNRVVWRRANGRIDRPPSTLMETEKIHLDEGSAVTIATNTMEWNETTFPTSFVSPFALRCGDMEESQIRRAAFLSLLLAINFHWASNASKTASSYLFHLLRSLLNVM